MWGHTTIWIPGTAVLWFRRTPRPLSTPPHLRCRRRVSSTPLTHSPSSSLRHPTVPASLPWWPSQPPRGLLYNLLFEPVCPRANLAVSAPILENQGVALSHPVRSSKLYLLPRSPSFRPGCPFPQLPYSPHPVSPFFTAVLFSLLLFAVQLLAHPSRYCGSSMFTAAYLVPSVRQVSSNVCRTLREGGHCAKLM